MHRSAILAIWCLAGCGSRSSLDTSTTFDAAPDAPTTYHHNCDAPPNGILSSGQLGPMSVAVDRDYVYWIDTGSHTCDNYTPPYCVDADASVMRCEICGCTVPQTIATGLTFIGVPFTAQLALDGQGGNASNVYLKDIVESDGTPPPANYSQALWSSVARCPVSGCAGLPVVIAGSEDQDVIGVWEIAANSTDLFWSNGHIMQTELPNGTITTLTDASGHLSLHYELTFSPEELRDLPATAFSWSVPHEWVLRLAGVPT